MLAGMMANIKRENRINAERKRHQLRPFSKGKETDNGLGNLQMVLQRTRSTTYWSMKDGKVLYQHAAHFPFQTLACITNW